MDLNKQNIRRSIYRKMLVIAFPIALENLIYTLINFVDVFMITGINPEAISALGIANTIFFVFACANYGIAGGASVLAAQFFGNKDETKLKEVLAIAIGLGLSFSLPYMLVLELAPRTIIGFFSSNQLVINYAGQYIKIIIWTYPLFAIGYTCTMLLRVANLPKLSLFASTFSLFINIGFNLILIPIYGVRGAAIATCIARIVSVSILVMVINIKTPQYFPKYQDVLAIKWALIHKTLKISGVTFANDMLWVIALSIKVMLLGKIGNLAFAAVQIVNSITGVMFTMFVGIVNATAIIIGNEIGANQLTFKSVDLIYAKAKHCLSGFAVISVCMLILLNILGPLYLNFMNLTPELLSMTKNLVHIATFVLCVEGFAYLFLVGILRSGGDTAYAMLIDTGCGWFCGLPAIALAVLVFKLPIYYVYPIYGIDELAKLIPAILRFVSKKWIKRHV